MPLTTRFLSFTTQLLKYTPQKFMAARFFGGASKIEQSYVTEYIPPLYISDLIPKEPSLCPMKKGGLPVIKKWAINEGWNPGKYDLDFCYHAHPESFFLLNSNGKTVGSIAITRYSSNFAFLGLLIVPPEERGKNHSVAIWNQTMNMLKDCRTIQFYGVMSRRFFYKPYGFSPIDYNLSFRINGEKIKELQASFVEKQSEFCFFRKPNRSDINGMVEFERPIIHEQRNSLIASFVSFYGNNTILAVNNRNNEILGYGALHSCFAPDTYTIKPLYARNQDIASNLLIRLLQQIPRPSEKNLGIA